MECSQSGIFPIFFYVMVALFIYVIILVTCTICGNVSSHHINAETVLYLQVCFKKTHNNCPKLLYNGIGNNSNEHSSGTC